jgi:hypothetical protein
VDKPIILDKLRAELQAAGIAVDGLVLTDQDGRRAVLASDDQGRWAELPAGSDVIVAAHDGTPPTPPDYGADAADLNNLTVVRQWVSATRTYIDLASPTAAETRAQVERNARAILAILRRMV